MASRLLIAGAALALLAGGSSVAQAAQEYAFSYAFAGDGAGNTVSGTFVGTGPISDIENITDIHMSLNGTPLSGPFYSWSYIGPANEGDVTNFQLGSGVVSNNPTLENFLFASTDIETDAALGSSNYFYIIQPWYNPGPGSTSIATQYSAGNGGEFINGYNGQYVPGNFSVTAVPEPAAWAMMLAGLGGLGAAMRSRRRASTASA